MEPMLNGQLMGNAIEISSRQLPHYYQLAKKAAEILNIPIPKIYMRQDPYLNAMTYGNGSQSLIVLSHSLLDQLDDSMLMFILGHEMGHIAADHAHGDISPQFWDLGMHW
jgi:heat shock protein HtpX